VSVGLLSFVRHKLDTAAFWLDRRLSSMVAAGGALAVRGAGNTGAAVSHRGHQPRPRSANCMVGRYHVDAVAARAAACYERSASGVDVVDRERGAVAAHHPFDLLDRFAAIQHPLLLRGAACLRADHCAATGVAGEPPKVVCASGGVWAVWRCAGVEPVLLQPTTYLCSEGIQSDHSRSHRGGGSAARRG